MTEKSWDRPRSKLENDLSCRVLLSLSLSRSVCQTDWMRMMLCAAAGGKNARSERCSRTENGGIKRDAAAAAADQLLTFQSHLVAFIYRDPRKNGP